MKSRTTASTLADEPADEPRQHERAPSDQFVAPDELHHLRSPFAREDRQWRNRVAMRMIEVTRGGTRHQEDELDDSRHLEDAVRVFFFA